VSLVVTELAVIEPAPQGLMLKERAPGIDIEQIVQATAAKLTIPANVPEMTVSA
jgi:acyl CoA:acetate/3-ketoacid CoA transferase beta subunit